MKQDFQVRAFWEEVVRAGPMGLTRIDWSTIEHKLDESARAVFRRFLESLEAEAEWITHKYEEIRHEAARIEILGDTMRKAGMRSYTDKEGRIFIAARRTTEKESGERG